MSRAAKAEEPKPRTYIKRIEVDITEDEARQRGEELARIVKDIERVEAEKKASNADLKKRIDALDARKAELAEVIRTGREDREVEVFNARNESRCLIETCRADDGEIIESRPMTATERQLKMFPDTMPDSADELVDSAIDHLNEEARDDEEPADGDAVELSNPRTGKKARVSGARFKKAARR